MRTLPLKTQLNFFRKQEQNIYEMTTRVAMKFCMMKYLNWILISLLIRNVLMSNNTIHGWLITYFRLYISVCLYQFRPHAYTHALLHNIFSNLLIILHMRSIKKLLSIILKVASNRTIIKIYRQRNKVMWFIKYQFILHYYIYTIWFVYKF